ncbi:MAG TPA: hypothetical protein VM452_04565 [Caulifigura sp.]|nr:hypothetical protein [Caulifigura sp.]
MSRTPWQDAEWRPPVAALSGCAAVLVAAVLVTRLGSAPQAIAAWWTLATALLVATLSTVCVELLDQLSASSPSRSAGRIAGAAFATAVTSIAILATTRHAGPTQLAFAWTLCLLFAATAGYWAIARSNPAVEAAPASTATDSAPATLPLEPVHTDHELPDHVQQTLSRYLADGRDHLEACVRVRFEPGQQSAIVHLPIQPAMYSIPDVECEPVGEDDLRITVDPIQPFGVRLVCRRPAPATLAGEAIVAVLISADRIARAAA